MEAVVRQAVNQVSLVPICKRPDVLDNKYLQHLAISKNGLFLTQVQAKALR